MNRVVISALLVATACTDHGPGPQPKKIEAEYIRKNLLEQVPADLARLDVELGGGKVVYLGNKIGYPDNKDPSTPLAPGGTIRVFHAWQVKQPPGPQWQVFTIVRGAEGSADFMMVPPSDMEIAVPVGKWKQGQIIQDVQDIVLRPDWHSPTATIYTGLIEKHGHQLDDRMAATAKDPALVKDRAIVARTIPVDLSKAPPPAGTVYVPHAAGPIVIDGVANEPGWTNAATSPEFTTADGSPEAVGKATARMTWDEQNLYLFVQVVDTDIYSQFTKHDEPLWKADCVEMFIDADGNRQGYVELQVNPNNATFDSFFATTRGQPGDEKWDSNMVTAVKVRNTADKPGDADQGWEAEIAVPLAAVKGRADTMAVQIPPRVGDRWHLNVVRVDTRSAGGNPSASSWNRITYSDFHALDRMLTIVFADPTGSITPQAAPPPPPAPPPTPVEPAQGSAGTAAPAPPTVQRPIMVPGVPKSP